MHDWWHYQRQWYMFYFPVPLRKARRLLSRSQLRRACRQPCEQISLRRVPQGPAQVPVLAPPHPSLRMRGPIVIHDWHSSALFSSVCQFMVWSFICLFNLLPLILLLLKLSLPPLDKRLIIIKHLANNPTTHKKKNDTCIFSTSLDGSLRLLFQYLSKY